ncbi:LysE family transporter [Ramlibacter sp.]|uniref:LysE family translocator n=1 Tax=Ramlibacter sp. TaxID=1917967 RepID=UPI001834A981|nr:LysE family transporter [Ramlibacter sp.]MBA2676194.1 LysE family transporter [Ramlibacter sp.]
MLEFNVGMFVLSVVVILLTPGPTNTLLAAAGLERGARGAAPLLGFELAGYLIAITGWGLFLTTAQQHYPWLGTLVRLGASCYLAYIALKLWLATRSMAADARPKAIGPKALFFATLLNPKGLLFASAIFPAHAFDTPRIYLPAIALFVCLLLPIGFIWIKFGAALASGKLISPVKVQRVAAFAIAMFSVSIAWAAFH